MDSILSCARVVAVVIDFAKELDFTTMADVEMSPSRATTMTNIATMFSTIEKPRLLDRPENSAFPEFLMFSPIPLGSVFPPPPFTPSGRNVRTPGTFSSFFATTQQAGTDRGTFIRFLPDCPLGVHCVAVRRMID
jgi:hypothetical protein